MYKIDKNLATSIMTIYTHKVFRVNGRVISEELFQYTASLYKNI